MVLGARSGLDVTKMRVLPKRFTLPLRREVLDPVPELAARRETEPVSRLGRAFGMNVWMVTGYQEARAVLMDSAAYSNDLRPLVASEGSSEARSIGGLGFTDPPDHTRLRRFLTPEFTMRRLARLRPVITELVERQLDELEAKGPVADLVSGFGFPVPFQVICELLGLPEEDRTPFHDLGPARFDMSRGAAGAFSSADEARGSVLAVVRKQRAEPGEGLIGGIIRQHGDALTDVELAGLVDGVFLGGYETSASMLALGTLALLQDPEALAMIRNDDAAVDGIVEELLRYLGVVQVAFPRFARQDHELFGQQIKRGDLVAVSLLAADRDKTLGEGLERFDPGRPKVPHLAFGQGLHRCVGSELARMELRIAFRALARRFPDLGLAADPTQLRFRKLSIVYGVEELPVRLWTHDSAPRQAVDTGEPA
jgi:cytochrome P450